MRSMVDILFFEPHQGGTFFRRLIRDLDRHSFLCTSEWEGDMESRTHDWVLGIQSRLSKTVTVRSVDVAR